jgi:hypothetical protein
MKPSKAYTLNKADLINQAKSALIFLAPSLLAFLAVLTPAVNELVPDTTQKLVLLVIVKWVLDQGTGLLRKFLEGKK